MSEQKKKLEKITTPVGVAKYPRLNSPDTKFNAEGVYKCTLVLNEADKGVKEFLARITAAQKEGEALGKRQLKPGKKLKIADSPVKPHVNDDGEEVEGMVEVSAKMKASGVSKKSGEPWTRKPAIFDAKGKPTKAKVGGGSKVKLSVELSPFYTAALGAGVSIRLNAVQVIDLVEFSGGGDAKSYGFGEEDGYSADDESDTAGNADATVPDNAATGDEDGDEEGDGEDNADF